MQLLKPDQIAAWYKYSIESSGYTKLADFVIDIWKELVSTGNFAFPPGFLARLVDLMMAEPAGIKDDNQSALSIENDIIKALTSSPGFDKLEGLFIISGADRDTKKGKEIIIQLIERLPAFQCHTISMTPSDVEKSFSAPAIGRGLEAPRLLHEAYQSFLNQLKESNFKLTSIDIFEIGHPDLFKKTSDRIFYRRMMRATRGIRKWTQSVFTIKEESNWIIAKYGEPQVLPLGGYDALSNKGSISSLVPSELAYMDSEMEFDLFDYKFLENQLMYFKRDSGAIFRIRRDIKIHVKLTEFFEHERHLGLLFAWCLNLAEKIIETFVKDLVNVYIEFSGFEPSSLKEACNFITHFIAEKKLNDRIFISDRKNNIKFREKSQHWLISDEPQTQELQENTDTIRFIKCIYPQSEEFVSLNFDSQERELGLLVNKIIEGLVGNADR